MGPIRLLARAFFGRLFESDLMPEGLPQVQLVIWGTLLAATPPTGYTLLLRNQAGDFELAVLITLSMLAMGLVGLVIWDGVFPDRRDVRILGPLPVPQWRIVAARMAALGQVFLLFAAPVCIPQAIAIGLVASGHGSVLERVQGVGIHLAVVFMALTFVFCAQVAVQCLLLIALGRRAAHAASMAFQVLVAVGLMQLLVFMPDVARALSAGAQSRGSTGAALFLPPTWFLGLYHQLSGAADGPAGMLAQAAVLATVGAALLAVLLYAGSYGLLCRRALEGPAPQSHAGVRAAAARVLRGIAPPAFNAPLRSAVRQFAVRTLVRSRTHRMMLAVYAGVGLAFVLSSAVSLALQGGASVRQPGIRMLAMPLTLQFLLLVGIRVITAVPSEPKARWMFRACEPGDRPAALSGARDAMTVLVVLPTSVFALLQGLIFWTVPAALGHAAFCFAAGTCFSELLLARTDKLPFACTYFPGKSRVFTLWPFYMMAFSFYALGLARMDQRLLSRPARLAAVCAGILLLARALAFLRTVALRELPALRFEEEDPDRIFEGFNLSEGLAAATPPPQSLR